MRPTGKLHLGNYHGALRNWIDLQERLEGYFFVADWHALTTDYENPGRLQQHIHEMVVDWLAAGLDPDKAAIFVQSEVPSHAELHLLLSMITPLSWLERVPTYKDQQAQLKEKDLATYGFLGYPLLQSADILLYRPAWVPVGEDQVAHVEITREIARRFNHIYGRDPAFPKLVKAALGRLPPEARERYAGLRRGFQEGGDQVALAEARALVTGAGSLHEEQHELLLANLEGEHHRLLPAPEALLTPSPKVPGLDGRKMSKSYGNTIGLTEDPASIQKKVKGMTTDPARVRRTDPGTPEKCPVWEMHKLYSSAETRAWVQQGCTTAGIGCIECKQPVIEKICADAITMRDRAAPYMNNPGRVREILDAGAQKARATAAATMQVVNRAMHLLPQGGSAHMNIGIEREGTQAEMPFAMVLGEPLTEMPRDLYIPPQAMEVFLDAFEGPLDLLLYLIRRQNLNILDIPIAEITRQYMQYIELMSELQLDLAGEYLVMAATLAEIKSRMLLPRAALPGEDTEHDPRAELVRRLQEYERFKQAAQDLDATPRLERDHYMASADFSARRVVKLLPDITLKELLLSFKDVALRAEMFAHHHIQREALSVRARMSDVLANLMPGEFVDFPRLFQAHEGRMGVAVTFIAILELKREGLIEIVQNEPFAPIHICGADPAKFARVIEGSAEEVTEADGRLLAESIAAEGVDEAHHEESHEDETEEPRA